MRTLNGATTVLLSAEDFPRQQSRKQDGPFRVDNSHLSLMLQLGQSHSVNFGNQPVGAGNVETLSFSQAPSTNLQLQVWTEVGTGSIHRWTRIVNMAPKYSLVNDLDIPIHVKCGADTQSLVSNQAPSSLLMLLIAHRIQVSQRH